MKLWDLLLYWAGSIQPKYQPVRPGKVVHLKRVTRFSKLFRLDRTDPLSFGPTFPEILVEWIAPIIKEQHLKDRHAKISIPGQLIAQLCSDDSIQILLNLTRFLYRAIRAKRGEYLRDNLPNNVSFWQVDL